MDFVLFLPYVWMEIEELAIPTIGQRLYTRESLIVVCLVPLTCFIPIYAVDTGVSNGCGDWNSLNTDEGKIGVAGEEYLDDIASHDWVSFSEVTSPRN